MADEVPMRFWSGCCVALMLVSRLSAEDAPSVQAEPTPAAQAIVEKATKELARNQQVCDEANARVLVAAEKALKAEIDKLTKTGRLQEAQAVQRLLDAQRELVLAASGGRTPADVLGDRKPADLSAAELDGNWQVVGISEFVFANNQLSEKATGNTGILSEQGVGKNGKRYVVYRWSEGNNLMLVEIINKSSLNITCYQNVDRLELVTPDTHVWWTRAATRLKK
jgi:hypothetical protein